MAIIYTLIAIFSGIFLESFFVAFGGFRIIFLTTLIAFRKVNWKYLLTFLVVTSLIMDVVMHYPLGINLLVICIPLGILALLTIFIPIDHILIENIVKFVLFVIYYFLIAILPSLFLNGAFDRITWAIVFFVIIKAVISSFICLGVEVFLRRLRKRENSSQIKFK